MSIYAMSDLHLGFNVNKKMDQFGDNWINHHLKIKRDWLKKIKVEDLVLIPGDISWAMSLDGALIDLNFIKQLPGMKIFVKGNHDYWWKKISYLNSLSKDMYFIQNNYYKYNKIGICGTRGWLCPNDLRYTQDDERLYKREVNRLENTINLALADNCDEILVMMHYPPFNDKSEQSDFINVIEKYPKVKRVIYGHLHGKESFHNALIGIRNGVEYQLVSSDYLNFKFIKL